MKETAISFEPVISQTENAFFLKVTDTLVCFPHINESDLILIEPDMHPHDGDMVLCLSDERNYIGKLFYNPPFNILQAFDHSLKPVIFTTKKKKPGIKLYRIAEIRKKY